MKIEFTVVSRYVVEFPYEREESDTKFDAACDEIEAMTNDVVARSTLKDVKVRNISETQ